MPNLLDTFIEQCNLDSSDIWGNTFTWLGSDYVGAMGDLLDEDFLSENGVGRNRNAYRVLKVQRSQFVGAKPAINESIIYDSVTYEIVSIPSADTTSISYKLRIPLTSL